MCGQFLRTEIAPLLKFRLRWRPSITFFVVSLSSKRQMLELYNKLSNYLFPSQFIVIYNNNNNNNIIIIIIITFLSAFVIWDTDIVVRHSINPYTQKYGWTLCPSVQVCQQLLTAANTVLSIFCRYHGRIVHIISLSRLVPPCGPKLSCGQVTGLRQLPSCFTV